MRRERGANQAELGVTRAVAEKVMRQLPVVEFPGIRKVYVRRPDVKLYLERCTSAGEWRFVKTWPADARRSVTHV